MNIRTATKEDIQEIQKVRNAVRENRLSDPGMVTDQDCESYLTIRGRGWVAEEEGKIVGFAIADLQEHNIWALFLLPEFEQKGLGKLLHHTMLDWYFDQTDETVWLSTAPGTRAATFYRMQGWSETGRHGKELRFEMSRAHWKNRQDAVQRIERVQAVPIPTIDLFPEVDRQLIALLRSLSPEEWERPTLARAWRVKDIAAHLLDGNLRTISMHRDGYWGIGAPEIDGYPSLVTFLNELNATWVQAAQRLSPALLVDLLETTGREYHRVLQQLDPFAPALFSVAWAGEEESVNWFHVAREYTEKVHHQLQIRDAVGQPGLMTKQLFHPFIDTLMRGLPYAYRDQQAPEGTIVQVIVTSDIGGSWQLKRGKGQWKLESETDARPDAQLRIDPENAWKLFTKGLAKETAIPLVDITGDKELAETALTMISVMA